MSQTVLVANMGHSKHCILVSLCVQVPLWETIYARELYTHEGDDGTKHLMSNVTCALHSHCNGIRV